MTPVIYEYKGIRLKFYSNEHSPIHVHAFSGSNGMRVEFAILNGKVVKINYSKLKGYSEFSASQMADLKVLVNRYKSTIVKLWIDFVIKNKPVKRTVITNKIK